MVWERRAFCGVEMEGIRAFHCVGCIHDDRTVQQQKQNGTYDVHVHENRHPRTEGALAVSCGNDGELAEQSVQMEHYANKSKDFYA